MNPFQCLFVDQDNETDGISSPCEACKPGAPQVDGTSGGGSTIGGAAYASCCSYSSEFTEVFARDGGADFDRMCTAGGLPASDRMHSCCCMP